MQNFELKSQKKLQTAAEEGFLFEFVALFFLTDHKHKNKCI